MAGGNACGRQNGDLALFVAGVSPMNSVEGLQISPARWVAGLN